MNVVDARAMLRDSRQTLFDTIRGLNEEQFRHIPAGEEWSIATHLAHILRLDRELAAATRAVLAGEAAVMPHIAGDNPRDVDVASRMAIPQIVHGLLNARRELDELLVSLGDDGLDREIRHEKMPPTSVQTLVGMLAEHDEAHNREIARLVKLAPLSARVTVPLRQRS